eukprot:TRINITY_DN14972_c0_g1_i1.p1 TRINITY_DN14972_c0_g1~~TRINITY_DN14972_c0_g1_i1.p1  ORF type:complete len:980 (+),score=307.27 TRINITY_DN14972_c0_g1_i1:49-2988(+)
MARDESSEESIALSKISEIHGDEPEDDDDDDDMAEEGSEDESEENQELLEHLKRTSKRAADPLSELQARYGLDDEDTDDEAPSVPGTDASLTLKGDDFQGYGEGIKDRSTAALGLYPTISDPKLFMLRVKSGYARTLCAQIMYKCLSRGAKGEDLMIKSCFCRDHLSEYIYVEAHRMAHVTNVISGLQGAYRKMKLIPVGEMPSTLARTKKHHDVKAGSWGRFRVGVHKGDLCRILEVDDSKEVYEIEVVPRIDFVKLLSATPVTTNVAGVRVQRLKTRTRPMPRFFTDEQFVKTSLSRSCRTITEYQEMMQKRDPHGPDVKYMAVAGRKFNYDGKEIKVVRQSAINTDRHMVNMTTDEHMRFVQGKISTSGKDIRRLQEIREVDLAVGDKVVVTDGELRNTAGVVTEIYEDATGTKYKVSATNNEFLTEPVPFTKDALQKVIEAGAYVKILAGGHKGETGMVLTVCNKKNLVKLYSSSAQATFEVFMSDVAETRQISFGVPKYGEFEVFELVKMRGTGCGMITRIENGVFTILNDLGMETRAEYAELAEVLCGTKMSTTRKGRPQVALDKFGNEIKQNDAARVVSDKSLWEGKNATVWHVYGDAVWLEARDVRENMGFFVLSRHELWQIGGDKKKRNLGIDAYAVPEEKKVGVDHEALALETDRKKRKKKEQAMMTMVGKRVRICKGFYKGYLGVVKSVHEKQCRVELHTGELAITVSIDAVKAIDGSDSLATLEQKEDYRAAQEAKGGGAVDEKNAMMDVDKLSEVATSLGTTAPDWVSGITDLTLRSNLSGVSAGSRLSRISGMSGGLASGLKRGRTGSVAGSSAAGSLAGSMASQAKRLRGSASARSAKNDGPEEQSLAPLLPQYPWWMVKNAVGIFEKHGWRVRILEQARNHDKVMVELLDGAEGNRELFTKDLVKAEPQPGRKCVSLNRPDKPPHAPIKGDLMGAAYEGMSSIMTGQQIEMRPDWSIVELQES